MPIKKQLKNGSTAVIRRGSSSHREAIRRVLSKLPQIDAIFVLTDETNVVHVFSVVREFQSKLYTNLLRKEQALEKKFPAIAFEFHVRAHQGREPSEAVPVEAESVYAR